MVCFLRYKLLPPHRVPGCVGDTSPALVDTFITEHAIAGEGDHKLLFAICPDHASAHAHAGECGG